MTANLPQTTNPAEAGSEGQRLEGLDIFCQRGQAWTCENQAGVSLPPTPLVSIQNRFGPNCTVHAARGAIVRGRDSPVPLKKVNWMADYRCVPSAPLSAGAVKTGIVDTRVLVGRPGRRTDPDNGDGRATRWGLPVGCPKALIRRLLFTGG